ncbi:MAG: type II toxin-antitoxin system RelE/ParE family toxin [Mucilaginibacter sp.]
MAKRIVFSKKAEIDLERIITFNNLRNKSDNYSKQFFLKLTRRLKSLLKQPATGVKTDAEDLLLIWDKYYVFYYYDEVIITVTSIYHQKENVIR